MNEKDKDNPLTYGLALLMNQGCIQQKNILNFKKNSDLTMYHLMMMFEKTNSMFEYGGDFGKGKSEAISTRWLESIIQLKGFAAISSENGKLYANWGQLGGIPRYDYLPSEIIVNNPYIPINKQYKIDKDCIMFRNDQYGWGLYPLHCYFATKLRDNDQSRRVLLIIMRAMQMAYSSNTDTTSAIKSAFKKLEDGELAAIFDDKAMPEEENFRTYPFTSNSTSQTLIQLLEDYQYVKGSWYNEMGVQSNYNMKRETITASENILNVDSLLPFSDNMLNARKECVDKVNEMFDVNWTVDFSSAWAKLRREVKLKEELVAAEAQNTKNPPNSINGNNQKEGEDNYGKEN